MIPQYIHYGSDGFDPSKFRRIENVKFFTKPKGGFWGSPLSAEYGWAKWCKDNNLRECDKEESFIFTLKDSAKVLKLVSFIDLMPLPKRTEADEGFFSYDFDTYASVYLDFERLLKDGVDAIEIKIEGLYFLLYGWDCDSILVMNKDVVCL